MGKKLCKGKVRISKSSTSRSSSRSKYHEKKNPKDLFEVSRPYKVFITDPSNFKSLVQEHTGNGICNSAANPILISSSPTISSIISEPIDDQQVQTMQNKNNINCQDYYAFYGLPESSPEWSFDDSCSDMINVPLTTFDTWDFSEELNMPIQDFSNIDMINQDPSSLWSHDYQMSFPQYGDELENSWISEMNIPFGYNYYDNCVVQPEVREYSYDLSSTMSCDNTVIQ